MEFEKVQKPSTGPLGNVKYRGTDRRASGDDRTFSCSERKILAEVVAPLRVFLEELMVGAARRMKRVAKNHVIPPAPWTEDRLQVWEEAKDLVAHAVTLLHPRPGCQVLMFLDVSECH